MGSVDTEKKTGQGSAGPRAAAPPTGTPKAPDDVGKADDSKLSEVENRGDDAPPDDTLGEQIADPAAAGEIPGEDPEKPEEEDEDECGWGWGWWPFPADGDVSAPNNGDGYGDGAPAGTPPAGRPGLPPAAEMPPLPEELPQSPLLPVVPDPQDPLPGLADPAAIPVLSMPVIVLPPAVPGIGGGGGGSGTAPRVPSVVGTAPPPAAPRGTPAERPTAPRASDAAVPASYRAGYGEYLRTAGMPQVIAVAVPGATGIMLLTGAGGLIGYRQARAGRAIRAGASRRFSS